MMHENIQQLLEHQRRHWPGIYRGIVTDNADPSSMGRLKVKIPSISDSLEMWALPCVPYAGNQVGFFALPEAGANCWVMFEAADISYAVWIGFGWGNGEIPGPGKAQTKLWKTETFTVQVDDDASEMKMTNDTSTVTIGSEITSECSPATHTVSSSGVTSEAGAGKVEVTTTSVSVNNGALEVK